MQELLERYEHMTGDPPESFRAPPRRICLRTNTLKIGADELAARLRARGVTLEPVSFLPDAFFAEAPFSLGATEEYLLGLYALQEPASQLPVLALEHALGTLKERTILDMAAAPGSKTTQLAARMQNTGRIIALDRNRKRARALGNNLERLGVTNTFVYVREAEHCASLGIQVDAVLLDAPCSGNFCSHTGWLAERSVKDFQAIAQTQQQLLIAGLSVLRPGGILVYSTCSLEPEENEGVLTAALNERQHIISTGLPIGDPGLSAFDKPFRPDCVHARRLWPHRHGTQGFFVAVVQNGKGATSAS